MSSVLSFGDPRLHDSFWDRVNPHGGLPNFAPHLGECWIWKGRPTAQGYGSYQRRMNGKSPTTAHRAMMIAVHGEIPAGMHTDHLCRVRMCCNPRHLEIVTPRVNALRGFSPAAEKARRTHCEKGHLLSGDNLTWKRNGAGVSRQCRTCYVTYYTERYVPHGTPHYEKTKCPKGHPYDTANTYWRKDRDGNPIARGCRACRAEAARKSHERRRQRELAA